MATLLAPGFWRDPGWRRTVAQRVAVVPAPGGYNVHGTLLDTELLKKWGAGRSVRGTRWGGEDFDWRRRMQVAAADGSRDQLNNLLG